MNTERTLYKFYDFINLYNLLMRHCVNKNRTYNVKLYYIEDNLYFQIIDKESSIILHNDSIECTKEEGKILCDMITSEFILNHKIRYAAYIPMPYEDITLYNRITSSKRKISYRDLDYILNDKPLKVHVLENSVFTLSISLYDGIDDETERLHALAFEKAYENTKNLIKKQDF